LICPIDINEFNNLKDAIVKGFSRTMKNTSIRNIPLAKEGDVFNILYRKGAIVTPHEAKVAHL
jgi:hypothetical protein